MKLILSTLLAITLLSCSVDETKQSAEKYLNENLNDPSSYEFVSLDYLFTITQEDNLNYRIESFSDRDDGILEDLRDLKNELGNEIDSTACDVYNFVFRANNEFGALTLNNTRLYITPENEVRRIAYTENRWLYTCNELEEYREIVLKYLN